MGLVVLRLASPQQQASRSGPHDAAASESLVSFATDTGAAVAVTTACAAASAYVCALAGEMLGGDLAVQRLGLIADPFGQGIGRNLGRTIGGAAGAAAIRCPSRSGRTRSSSRVRFSQDVPFQVEQEWATQQHHAETHATSSFTAQPTATSEDRLVAAVAAQPAATRADTAADTQCIMESMAKMFGMARQESLDRENVLRDAIKSA